MRGEEVQPGTLYLCPTPIGNLEDITLRVLNTLRGVDLVVAEDTRRTRQLLSHFQVSKPLVSYHRHNRKRRERELLDRLASGENVALVSDAGSPAVSDPGAELVAAAARRGAPVYALPGPSATLVALGVSGLPGDAFFFAGYPPREAGPRRHFLRRLAGEPVTSIFFEAPHHLLETLDELYDWIGDRWMVVTRELTKKHEEVRRGPLSEHCAHFRAVEARGEFSLVLAGAPPDTAIGEEECREQSLELGRELMSAGVSHRDAARIAAKFVGVSRSWVYKELLPD